jgi:hypothetical protein
VFAAPADALSLADLERYDPPAPERGRERRFLCPRCGDQHPKDADHRSLSLNVETGLWTCHRCRASGKIAERWEDRRPLGRRERSRAQLRRTFGLAVTPSHSATAPPPVEIADACQDLYDRTLPLEGSPGADYLAGRGIPVGVATAAGVRWASVWYGRPAVVFPIRGRVGQLVGLHGRHTDGRENPKAHDYGKKSAGLFATPGALDGQRVVLVEGSIDALSLAAAGVPAAALCGLRAAEWTFQAFAFKTIALALDNDDHGDDAAVVLAPRFQAFGCRTLRWSPRGAKDWNALHLEHGLDAMREALGVVSTIVETPSTVEGVIEPGSPTDWLEGFEDVLGVVTVPPWKRDAAIAVERLKVAGTWASDEDRRAVAQAAVFECWERQDWATLLQAADDLAELLPVESDAAP